jgi:hypothetical protein
VPASTRQLFASSPATYINVDLQRHRPISKGTYSGTRSQHTAYDLAITVQYHVHRQQPRNVFLSLTIRCLRCTSIKASQRVLRKMTIVLVNISVQQRQNSPLKPTVTLHSRCPSLHQSPKEDSVLSALPNGHQ